jgi:acetate kinase
MSNAYILRVNGGSSSIKFTLFEIGDSLQGRLLEGRIERIGLPEAMFVAKGRAWEITSRTRGGFPRMPAG